VSGSQATAKRWVLVKLLASRPLRAHAGMTMTNTLLLSIRE
jgi:hypothetical protein